MAGLIPLPSPAIIPHVRENPLANNDTVGGQPLNDVRNMLAVDMKFEDIENYMVEKAKKESLELVQEL